MAEHMDRTEQAVNVAEAPLRDPQTVMRLARLGAFHQSRLSFMRVLLRRLDIEPCGCTAWVLRARHHNFRQERDECNALQPHRQHLGCATS